MIHFVKIPWSRPVMAWADYYGYWLGIVVGQWLILVGKKRIAP